MTKPDFMKPKVFKARDGRFLVIIYNDREEMYDFNYTATFKKLTDDLKTETDPNPEPHTRYDSIEMCKDSMREVHYSDKMKVQGLVCTCKEYEKYEGDKHPMGQKGCTCQLLDHGKVVQEIETDYVEMK